LGYTRIQNGITVSLQCKYDSVFDVIFVEFGQLVLEENKMSSIDLEEAIKDIEAGDQVIREHEESPGDYYQRSIACSLAVIAEELRIMNQNSASTLVEPEPTTHIASIMDDADEVAKDLLDESYADLTPEGQRRVRERMYELGYGTRNIPPVFGLGE